MSQHTEKVEEDEESVTTVEYAIADALIFVGAIGAFSLIGFEVTRIVTAIFDVLTAAVN